MAKQWWALQQPPNCEFSAWVMINTNQMHYLKISWHSYICFFFHSDSIPQKREMLASGLNRNTKQQNSGGHCSKRQIVNSCQHMGYDQCRPAKPFKTKLALMHVLLQSL
jgi:hypothetical protein